MLIGIDYTSAAHQRAGIGRYTRGIVGALAALRTTHAFTLVVAGSEKEAEGSDGSQAGPEQARNFRIRSLPLSHRFWTVIWHRLRLPLPVNLITGPLDVFHSPDYVLPPVSQAKKVVTVHDLSFLRFPEGAEPRLRRYLSAAVPRSVKEADLVLGDSQSTRQDIVELLGVNPDKVEVIYPGVDRAFRPIEDPQALAAARELYHLDFPFILSVGTLEPRKNLITLLDAYAALRSGGAVDHKLVVAGGKGWLYDGIFSRAAELSIQGDVAFLGYVAEEHLPALYCLSDVMVFPSLYEGFGLPPLEAMACGTPVITSDSSALPEVVGKAALMVPAGDGEALAAAINTLLADSDLRKDLVRKGLLRAAEFSWRASAEKLLTVYERLDERGVS